MTIRYPLIATLPTEGKVVVLMAREGRPMTVGQIARGLGAPPQKIQYHVTELLRKGVIVKKGTTYALQPLLCNSDDLSDQLYGLLQGLAKHIDLTAGETPEQTLVETVRYFLSFHEIVWKAED